jgi:hypothetical protein
LTSGIPGLVEVLRQEGTDTNYAEAVASDTILGRKGGGRYDDGR